MRIIHLIHVNLADIRVVYSILVVGLVNLAKTAHILSIQVTMGISFDKLFT